MALQPKWGPGLPFWGYVTITFLRGWIVSPAPNPQPGGPGLSIYDPRGQGDPAIPPRHWVPILAAFYDMNGLQWDYSLIPVTTRENLGLCDMFKGLMTTNAWQLRPCNAGAVEAWLVQGIRIF
jgi:hypothetical protein